MFKVRYIIKNLLVISNQKKHDENNKKYRDNIKTKSK